MFFSDTFHFYRPQRSCGQGNIFTPVYHSVHGGGACLRQTPPGQTSPPPGADTPPRVRHTHPRTKYTPPRKQTPTYGQRGAGTHPTGMHSCFFFKIHKVGIIIQLLLM